MIGWLAGNLLWSGATMLLVLAVRRPVARLFGAGAAYALWLLPALRLVLPPMPALGVGLPPLPAPMDIVVSVGGAAGSASSGASAGWAAWLLVLWVAGILAFAVLQWRAYRAFLGRLSLASRSLGAHEGIPLVESATVDGPIAVGLLDRRIVVPADFDRRYSPEERRLAIAHETVHHRRGDIWWNVAALLVLALSWFNPLAWLAFRAFREDQELACDAAVAASAGPEARHDYARALVKSASRPGLITACPLNHADQLKRRLRMMKHHRRSRLRLLGGGAAITLLAGLTAAVGTPGIAHPHAEGEGKQHRERVMIMSHKGEGSEHASHRMRLHHGDGEEMGLHDCPEGEATRVDEGEGDERTRIVLCTRGATTPAERVERLRQARERLAQDDHLSAGHRERVTAALDREIARLQAQ